MRFVYTKRTKVWLLQFACTRVCMCERSPDTFVAMVRLLLQVIYAPLEPIKVLDRTLFIPMV